MIATRDWDSVRKFLADKKKLLVTAHVHPDGDAIGSQMALAHFLWQMEKQVYLLSCDHTPKFFQFLDPNGHIKLFRAEEHLPLIKSLDGAVVVDISDWRRLQEIGEAMRQFSIPVACIDHHIPTDVMGKVQVLDQSASSTGELLYDFFMDSHAVFTPEIVEALYTCILTDTGSFRFSNTTAVTHRIAADLLTRGVDYRKIYEHVYETYSKNRSLLLGHLLANMHFEREDRLAWFVLSQDLLKKTGAELWEAEGFSELPRSIEGNEISLMFTESENNTTKVSFRSKGRIAINELANKFGGGGHKFASGATLAMPLNEAIAIIVQEAKNLLDGHENK
jgi:phosphoesterase RecJ-like protein